MLALFALPVSCVDSAEPARKPYCRAFCEFQDLCLEEVNVVTTPATLRQCQRECLQDPRVELMSDQALQIAEECSATRSCQDDTRAPVDQDPVWYEAEARSACFEEAGREVSASRACRDHCEDLMAAQEACGVVLEEDDCRARLCGFEDEAFAGATCLDEDDCDALSECVAGGLP
jgi:hypothetical protein